MSDDGAGKNRKALGGTVKVDTVNECPLFQGNADLELLLQSPGPEPLRKGDGRKDAVLKLERALVALGYKPGEEDGVYTDETARAVAEFQKKHVAGYAKKLNWPEPVDPPYVAGEVGFLTINAMDAAIGKSTGEPPAPPPSADTVTRVPKVKETPRPPAEPKSSPPAEPGGSGGGIASGAAGAMASVPAVNLGSAKAYFDEAGWFHIEPCSADTIPEFKRFDPPTPTRSKGKPGESKKYWLVMHYTAGWGEQGKPGRLMVQGGGASTHFLIGRSGGLSQLASVWDGTGHAGGLKPRDKSALLSKMSLPFTPSDGNSKSIGLDFCNVGFFTAYDEKKKVYYRSQGGGRVQLAESKVVQAERFRLKYWEMYPEAQLRTFVILMKALVKFHPEITRNRIVGHEDTRADKVDPGPALPLEKLLDEIYGG